MPTCSLFIPLLDVLSYTCWHAKEYFDVWEISMRGRLKNNENKALPAQQDWPWQVGFCLFAQVSQGGLFFQIILQPDAMTAWTLQWLLCKHGDDMTQEGNLDISCQEGYSHCGRRKPALQPVHGWKPNWGSVWQLEWWFTATPRRTVCPGMTRHSRWRLEGRESLPLLITCFTEV